MNNPHFDKALGAIAESARKAGLTKPKADLYAKQAINNIITNGQQHISPKNSNISIEPKFSSTLAMGSFSQSSTSGDKMVMKSVFDNNNIGNNNYNNNKYGTVQSEDQIVLGHRVWFYLPFTDASIASSFGNNADSQTIKLKELASALKSDKKDNKSINTSKLLVSGRVQFYDTVGASPSSLKAGVVLDPIDTFLCPDMVENLQLNRDTLQTLYQYCLCLGTDGTYRPAHKKSSPPSTSPVFNYESTLNVHSPSVSTSANKFFDCPKGRGFYLKPAEIYLLNTNYTNSLKTESPSTQTLQTFSNSTVQSDKLPYGVNECSEKSNICGSNTNANTLISSSDTGYGSTVIQQSIIPATDDTDLVSITEGSLVNSIGTDQLIDDLNLADELSSLCSPFLSSPHSDPCQNILSSNIPSPKSNTNDDNFDHFSKILDAGNNDSSEQIQSIRQAEESGDVPVYENLAIGDRVAIRSTDPATKHAANHTSSSGYGPGNLYSSQFSSVASGLNQRLHNRTDSLSSLSTTIGGIDFKHAKIGTVRYLGPIHVSEGTWVGVELDLNIGKNDGRIEEKRYFKCKPNYGLFVKQDKVTKLSDCELQDFKRRLSSSIQTSCIQRRPSVGMQTNNKNLSNSNNRNSTSNLSNTGFSSSSPSNKMNFKPAQPSKSTPKYNSTLHLLTRTDSQESLRSEASFMSLKQPPLNRPATLGRPLGSINRNSSGSNKSSHKKPPLHAKNSSPSNNTTLNPYNVTSSSLLNIIDNADNLTDGLNQNKIKKIDPMESLTLMKLRFENDRIKSDMQTQKGEITRLTALLKEKLEEFDHFKKEYLSYKSRNEAEIMGLKSQIEDFEKQNEDLEHKLQEEKQKCENYQFQVEEFSILTQEKSATHLTPTTSHEKAIVIPLEEVEISQETFMDSALVLELKEALTAKETECEQLYSENGKLRNRLDQLETEWLGLSQKTQELTMKNLNLESELSIVKASYEDRLKETKQLYQQSLYDTALWQQKYNEVNSNNEKHAADIKLKTDEIESKVSELQIELRKEFEDKLSTEKTNLQNQYEQKEKEFNARVIELLDEKVLTDARIDQLKETIDHLKTDYECKEMDLARYHECNGLLQKSLDATQTELQTLNDKVEFMNDNYAAVERDYAKSKDIIIQKENDLHELRAQKLQLETQVDDLQVKISKLEAQEFKYENIPDSLKDILNGSAPLPAVNAMGDFKEFSAGLNKDNIALMHKHCNQKQLFLNDVIIDMNEQLNKLHARIKDLESFESNNEIEDSRPYYSLLTHRSTDLINNNDLSPESDNFTENDNNYYYSSTEGTGSFKPTGPIGGTNNNHVDSTDLNVNNDSLKSQYSSNSTSNSSHKNGSFLGTAGLHSRNISKISVNGYETPNMNNTIYSNNYNNILGSLNGNELTSPNSNNTKNMHIKEDEFVKINKSSCNGNTPSKLSKFRHKLANPADLLFNKIASSANAKIRQSKVRLYCDNCQIFDAHDTGDCPSSHNKYDRDEENSVIINGGVNTNNHIYSSVTKSATIPINKNKDEHVCENGLATNLSRRFASKINREYCDKCEVFGHDALNCRQTFTQEPADIYI